MKNLIKENIEVGAPANPVIVQNVASLPGGVEVGVNNIDTNHYPGGMFEVGDNYYPKVLKAGHVVYEMVGNNWWSANVDHHDTFLSCGSFEGESAYAYGVVTEDAPVYYDENKGGYYAVCSIMLIGVVDAMQMPAGLGVDSIFDDDQVNCKDICHIAFINR